MIAAKSRIPFIALLAFSMFGVIPQAIAADTQAPVLVDWKLLDEKTDISTGDGILRLQFSISDDSNIEIPITSVHSQTTSQSSGLVLPILISKVGNVSTYSAEARIAFGKAPGLWKWSLVPLRDSLGNATQGFGPGGLWPVDVWVYDKELTEAARQASIQKAAEDKAAAEKQLAFDQAAAAEFMAKQLVDSKAAAAKQLTISCVKGKVVRKVTAVKPACPSGFKKK